MVHNNNKSKEAINKIAKQLKCFQKLKKINIKYTIYKLLICFFDFLILVLAISLYTYNEFDPVNFLLLMMNLP